MKTESDYTDGDTILYRDRKGKQYAGTIDYNVGEECDGFIRIREHMYETSDIGNTLYVPVENVGV